MEWIEPTTIKEAELKRAALAKDIRSIQVQLAAQTRSDPTTGIPLSRKEYENWRQKALRALNGKMTEITQVNAWLKANRSQNKVNYLKRLLREIYPHLRALPDLFPEDLLARIEKETR